MAEYVKNFKKCRIMLRDATSGELLADTDIVEHDVGRNILTIGTDHLSRRGADKVIAAVFAPKGLFEYSGTVRREIPGTNMEIAVYGEKQREERGYRRYEMQTGGRVECLFINGHKVEFRRPIPVNVKNISANGILFQSGVHDFSVGDRIRLRIGFRESEFSSEYEIVRTQNRQEGFQEYGCRNLVEAEQETEDIPAAAERRQPDRESAEAAAREFVRRQRELEDKLGYQKILDGVQRFVLMLQTPEVVEHPMVFDDPRSQEGVVLHRLAKEIRERAPVMNRELLLNACCFKCGSEEARARHILNTALLSALMGVWSRLEEERLIRLAKAALLVGVPVARQLFEDDGLSHIVTAADIYDMRASHPNKTAAAVPFAALEQFYLQGQNEAAGSVRGMGKMLAERILHALVQKQVALADKTEASVLYIPPNDITHPVLALGETVWQEENPWGILGFVVDKTKYQEAEEG